MNSPQCKVCARWLEIEAACRNITEAARADLQRQMKQGHCDGCFPPMTLLELVRAYADAYHYAQTCPIAVQDVACSERDQLYAEIERRFNLAVADRPFAWLSHLDEVPASIKRQIALLRSVAAAAARGEEPAFAVDYVRQAVRDGRVWA